MKINTDPIISSNQKGGHMWQIIFAEFRKSYGINPHVIRDRGYYKIKGRYWRLAENIIKWVSDMSESRNSLTSGMNDTNLESDAQSIYASNGGSVFMFTVEWDYRDCKNVQLQ